MSVCLDGSLAPSLVLLGWDGGAQDAPCVAVQCSPVLAALPGLTLTSVPQPGGRCEPFVELLLRFGTVAPGVHLITSSA